MQSSTHSIAALTTSLLILLSGCSFSSTAPESAADGLQPIQTDPPNQSIKTDTFRDAVNKATEAANLAQTAKTSEEWSTLANIWQQATTLMQKIPASSPNYETAQQKAIEYQKNFEYAQGNNATPVDLVQQVEEPTKQSLPIAQQAAQLKMGMTYREVVTLLGRMPNTVLTDQIRQELGEPIQGHNLISFEWRNDNPACHPVSVQFDPSGMTATGWDEGKTCPGSSIFNEPFGKDCAETTLCKLG